MFNVVGERPPSHSPQQNKEQYHHQSSFFHRRQLLLTSLAAGVITSTVDTPRHLTQTFGGRSLASLSGHTPPPTKHQIFSGRSLASLSGHTPPPQHQPETFSGRSLASLSGHTPPPHQQQLFLVQWAVSLGWCNTTQSISSRDIHDNIQTRQLLHVHGGGPAIITFASSHVVSPDQSDKTR